MRSLVWTFSICMLLGIATGVYASSRRAAVLRKVAASTVVIFSSSKDSTSQGSGTVLGSAGGYEFIVTCHHVIEGAEEITLYPTGRPDEVVTATLEADDPDGDLALLVVRGLTLPVLPVAAKGPELYDTIYAVGAPMTEPGTASEGIITDVAYPVEKNFFYRVTNAFVAPGISGGTATNTDGQFVGVPARGSRSTTQFGLLIPGYQVSKLWAPYFRSDK